MGRIPTIDRCPQLGDKEWLTIALAENTFESIANQLQCSEVTVRRYARLHGITSRSRSCREYTSHDYGRILELFDTGFTPAAIAAYTHIPYTSVYCIIRRYGRSCNRGDSWRIRKNDPRYPEGKLRLGMIDRAVELAIVDKLPLREIARRIGVKRYQYVQYLLRTKYANALREFRYGSGGNKHTHIKDLYAAGLPIWKIAKTTDSSDGFVRTVLSRHRQEVRA